MSHTPAVVFDLGKVLVDFDYRIAIKRLLHRATCTAEKLQELMQQTSLLYQYESGALASQDFFAQVRTVTGFQGDFAEFKPLFCDIFTPIPPMIELHATLRARGLPTYIFSNTNELQINFIRRQFPFFSNFNGYVYSFEHRAMKPQSQLYEVVEKCSGLSGPHLYYVDDRPENIQAGQQRGWQTHLHVDPDTTRAFFRQAGLVSE